MTYTERRKADRLSMAKAIEQIAQKHGATCEVEGDGHEMHVYVFHPSGLAVTLWLDGKSTQPDVHIIPWHIKYGCAGRLASSFGDVNPYHRQKATHVRHGWDALAAEIERGFSAAADGSAFEIMEACNG